MYAGYVNFQRTLKKFDVQAGVRMENTMPYEYTVKGKVVRLPISHDKVAVRFEEPSDAMMRLLATESARE